jgi:hypothetical protein
MLKKGKPIIGVLAAKVPTSHFAMGHTKTRPLRRWLLLQTKTKRLIFARVSRLKTHPSVMEPTKAYENWLVETIDHEILRNEKLSGRLQRRLFPSEGVAFCKEMYFSVKEAL